MRLAQAELRSVYMACQDFWISNSGSSPCFVASVSNADYGFEPSPDVEIAIDSDTTNTEYDFFASASHTASSSFFVVDTNGAVSQNNDKGKKDKEKKEKKEKKSK
jgi:hypothetical protein